LRLDNSELFRISDSDLVILCPWRDWREEPLRHLNIKLKRKFKNQSLPVNGGQRIWIAGRGVVAEFDSENLRLVRALEFEGQLVGGVAESVKLPLSLATKLMPSDDPARQSRADRFLA